MPSTCNDRAVHTLQCPHLPPPPSRMPSTQSSSRDSTEACWSLQHTARHLRQHPACQLALQYVSPLTAADAGFLTIAFLFGSLAASTGQRRTRAPVLPPFAPLQPSPPPPPLFRFLLFYASAASTVASFIVLMRTGIIPFQPVFPCSVDLPSCCTPCSASVSVTFYFRWRRTINPAPRAVVDTDKSVWAQVRRISSKTKQDL